MNRFNTIRRVISTITFILSLVMLVLICYTKVHLPQYLAEQDTLNVVVKEIDTQLDKTLDKGSEVTL